MCRFRYLLARARILFSIVSSKTHRIFTAPQLNLASGYSNYAGRVYVSVYSVRPGRGHSAEVDGLVAGYLKRLGGPWKADSRVFRTEAALLEQCAAERREGAAVRWLLDSRGKALSSEALAAALGKLRDGGVRRLVTAIGPADGWSAEAAATLQGGDMLLSLGPMTLPHELARLVLAEQIYRATTILGGHPYHLGHE